MFSAKQCAIFAFGVFAGLVVVHAIPYFVVAG